MRGGGGRRGKRARKSFDFARFGRRHVALKVAYDGRGFHGLASQGGGEDDNSVEKHLFDALRKVKLIEGRESAGFSRSGRTDRGVSAFGQVLALRLRSAFEPHRRPEDLPRHPLDPDADADAVADASAAAAPGLAADADAADKTDHEIADIEMELGDRAEKRARLEDLVNAGPAPGPAKAGAKAPRPGSAKGAGRVGARTELDYCTMLNRVLPPEIRVLAWAPVTEEFSARFSTDSRTYRYFFSARGMDLAAMDTAAKLLEGEHDFRNFCKMDVIKASSFVRRIHRAGVRVVDPRAASPAEAAAAATALSTATLTMPEIAVFEIKGSAFLWHMVRCIMKILTYVGRRLEQPGLVTQLLAVDVTPRKPHYQMAPDTGLVLHECGYGGRLDFEFQPLTLAHLQGHLTQRYEQHAVEAAKTADQLQALARATLRPVDAEAWVRQSLDFSVKKGFPRNRAEALGQSLATRIEARARDGADLRWADLLGILAAEGVELDDLGHLETPKLGHQPLLQRATAPTYEDKIRLLGPRRREAYDEKQDVKRRGRELVDDDGEGQDGAPTPTHDEAFFKKMLSEGKLGPLEKK